jgi:hypothetical protein
MRKEIMALKDTENLDESNFERLGFTVEGDKIIAPGLESPPKQGDKPGLFKRAEMDAWKKVGTELKTWKTQWDAIISTYKTYLTYKVSGKSLKDLLSKNWNKSELDTFKTAVKTKQTLEEQDRDRDEYKGKRPIGQCSSAFVSGFNIGKARGVNSEGLNARMAEIVGRAKERKLTDANRKSLSGMPTLKSAVDALQRKSNNAAYPAAVKNLGLVPMGGRRHTRSRKHKKSKKTRRH